MWIQPATSQCDHPDGQLSKALIVGGHLEGGWLKYMNSRI